MKLRTIIYLLSCLLWTACSDDELQPATADEATTVPITLTLGQRATRSAPPGSTDPMNPTVDGEAETEQTNTVRIIAFRCKETQENVSYSNDENYADSDFVYDPTNDQTVTCSRATTSAHRLTAHGQLKKMKGYAYRVVALAYSLTRSLPFSNHLLADVGEENLFTLNLAAHTTLDQFEADLTHVGHDSWTEFRNGTDKTTKHNPAIHNTRSLSGQLCYAPQLFYGQCTSVNGNKVIHFHEKNAADSISSTYPLLGVLYRGMAKVQLTLKIDKLNKIGTLQWIGLLANETRTSVKLSAYDDFLQPFNPIHTTMKKWHLHLGRLCQYWTQRGQHCHPYRLALANRHKIGHSHVYTQRWFITLCLQLSHRSERTIIGRDGYRHYLARRGRQYVLFASQSTLPVCG